MHTHPDAEGDTPLPARTLGQILAAHAQAQPNKTLFTFLHADGGTLTITYGQFTSDVRTTAQYFQQKGVRPQTPVVIAMDYSYEIVCAFWGAIWMGAHPMIFPYVSSHGKTQLYTNRLPQLVQRVPELTLVTTPSQAPWLAEILTGDSLPRIVALDKPENPEPHDAGLLHPAAVDPAAPAYIQFSSGTTGTPKGFYISHAACHFNLSRFNGTATLDFSAASVAVGWLPFYHDMGLATLILAVIIQGASSVLMAPQHWLRRPRILFEAIQQYQGTTLWMPNLGYSHSLRYVDDETLARLDLSNVRTFGWGAEPIDPHKITEFVARFARAGLSPQAAVIGYGMAEYTLCVTVSSHRAPIRAQRVPVQSLQIGQRVNPLHTWDPTQPESVPVPPAATRGQPATLDLVGCGFPLEHTELAIRTYDGIAHSDYVVGEVLLRGHQPSLFSGNFPPAVTPMPVTEDDGWFNTGDLGYLVNGELFICGRQKDLLIVGGENILPDAIESIARQELGADARRAAAFGITNAVLGTEVPVLVCEAKGLQEPSAQFEAIRCIRRAVQSRLGINLGDAQLVRPGWIQVTTSGKLARQATRQKYLEEFGEPMAARVDVTQSEHAVLIASLMAEMLQLPDVGMDDDFFELGGDSLAATRFVLAVESVFGQTIPEDFYAQATVRHLVDFLARTER